MGAAMQELMHKQSFGTSPIDSILERINNNLPQIAKQANVDVIVSKWDVVYQQDGVEFVDITNAKVQPFNLDEAVQAIIAEIQQIDPVPIEELENH